jgi:predicted metal-dependent phosphoesterase TrpH
MREAHQIRSRTRTSESTRRKAHELLRWLPIRRFNKMEPSSDSQKTDWIKVDLHIHTLDDPKDALDYSAHQLLERARGLGFRVLAITLHDAVFDRPEVFADAASMGILIIPAAEVRLEGADVILLNVTANEIGSLRNLDDLQALRIRRGQTLFTIAPHPFYVLGGSIGEKLVQKIDCFDAIEVCHFWTRFFNLNRRAMQVAARFQKPLIATSDAHQLHAFGSNYTSIPRPAALTIENVLAALRSGPLRLTNPPCSFRDLISTLYWLFVAHPLQIWSRKHHHGFEARRGGKSSSPGT